jgi:hypothetical protein
MSLRTPGLTFLCTLLLVGPLSAQDDAPPTDPPAEEAPPEDVAAEAPTEPSPEAMAAAANLLDVMDLGAVTRATTESMLDNMMAQNPALVDYRHVFAAFFEEHMRWEDLRDDYQLLYAEVYTPAELEQLAEFYQTPLGRRLLETLPHVSARGAQIGEAAVQPHLPELQRRLSEAMEASMGSIEQ